MKRDIIHGGLEQDKTNLCRIERGYLDTGEWDLNYMKDCKPEPELSVQVIGSTFVKCLEINMN